MRLTTLLPLLGLFAFGYAEKCPTQKTSLGKEILCYTSSNNADQLLDSICKCTTLVHQGHELHNLSIAGVEELQKTLKETNPALQVVVSVTDPQGTLRTSATTRQEASGRLANLLSQVDGIELDMSAGSKERLSHFVKGLKDEMIRKSNEKRIILALPTKAEDLAKQYDLKTLTKYIDLFTLSTHYLVDDTESFNTFHPSRLMGIFDMLNTDSLVDLVSGMGVPKKKLLVSVPASAYKFTLKDEEKNVPGSSVKEEEPTAITQKELCDMMNAGEWTVERDTDLTAPYAFKDSTWIAYEDKTSVGIKGKYVLLRELAGLGVHNIENDVKNDCGKPVTHEVYRSFTDMKRKTRGAVLASLENDLQHAQIPQSRHVKSSGFRIVRVVDTAGAIHAIRENTQTEFICTRQGYFVHPKSCNRFYRCVKFNQGIDDYSVFEFDCPAGLAFDERTEVCVWPGSLTEGSPCPGSSEIAPVPRARFQCPQRSGYYADPQNCRWFFACFDIGEPELTAYEFRCPFGLVFDEEKLICEWPWLVPGCGVSGYSRTEYGGSGSGYAANANGYGSGSGQGSIAGGIGIGGYAGSGIGAGITGQYAEADGSSYAGYKGSESRQTETETGTGAGAGAGGYQYGNSGLGGHGTYPNSGITGSFGAGNGASIYSGGSGASTLGSGAGLYGKGGYAGSGYGGSTYAGNGVTNTLYSGAGSTGSKYGNHEAGSGATGNYAGYGYGSKYSGSTGSGAAHSAYAGQTGSTNAYNGQGKTGVVIETQGHDSPVYTTVAAGSGHSGTGGYGGSSGFVSSTGGNSAYNGFGNTAGTYQGSDVSGKDGITVSLQTGGAHGASAGVTGYDHSAGSGYYQGNGASGNAYSSEATQSGYYGQGHGGYITSGGADSDSQDVINGGSYSGSSILTGTTGNLYNGGLGTKGSYTSVTKNNLNGLDHALNVFGVKKPGSSAPGISVQTVTPGYSVTGSGVNHGIVYGGSGSGVENGAYVTGSNYGSGNTASGNVVVNHGSDYSGAYVSSTPSSIPSVTYVNSGAEYAEGNAHRETGSSQTISNIGKGGVSTGTTTYHGNGGSSSSYLNSNTNSNTNGDSVTVLSHGDNPSTPGYAIHGVSQTTYGSAAPGTFLTGTAAPGVILQTTADSISYSGGHGIEGGAVYGSLASGASTYHGNTGDSGFVVSTGNTAGLSYGGIGNGVVGSTASDFGNKATYTASSVTNSNRGMGYKTNEYGSNGGRGTVTFNNGYSASKFTESDLRDQPAYASLPDTIVSGGRIENSAGSVLGSTLAGINSYTSHGIAQSGVTNTGFKSTGGSGSYQTNTRYSHPTPTPVSNIFEEHTFGERYTVGSSIGNDVNNLAYVTSTISPDVSHIDTSKINLGHSSTEGESSGYKYDKPSIPFVTGGITASTPAPFSVTYHQPIVPLTATTPSPYLNIETVYNTPSVVTSAPITAAPAVVNTYSYRRPTGASSAGTISGGYKYKSPAPTVVYQSSGDAVQHTTVYKRPINIQNHYTVTPTPTPIAYATGPAEIYKNTLFEAAKHPVSVSTLSPVYDTGYKTVVSSTPAPIPVSTGQYFYSDSRFKTGSVSSTPQPSGHLDITYQIPEVNYQKEYVSSTAVPNTGGGYFYEKPKNPLTYNSPSTVSPSVTTIYQQPEVTFQKQYVSSTPAPNTGSGYVYEKPSKQLTYNSPTPTPNTGSGYVYEKPSKQLTYNSPTPVPNTGSGYVYEKPSKQLTYNSPVSTATPVVSVYQPKVTIQQHGKYIQSTITPDFDDVYQKPSVSIRPVFNKQPTYQKGYTVSSTPAPVSDFQGYEYSKPAIKFVTSTAAPVYTESERYSYSNGGSPEKLDISQKEITKLVGNYNRGGARYTPPQVYVDVNSEGGLNSGNTGFGNKAFVKTVTSETYRATTPVSYGRYTPSTGGYTSGSGIGSSGYKTGVYGSTPLYEVSTVKPVSGRGGKGKVIVKLSDLHPLLLGKLGAQCTCRADPFETLRGPGSKIVKSSRGDIDLAQYDESQIYVDLESEDEPNRSAALYNSPSASPSISPSVYSSSLRTPVTAVFGLSTPAPKLYRSRGKPSTAYLPVSSSASPISDSRGGLSSPIIVAPESRAYDTSSDNLDPQYINVRAGYGNEEVPVGRSAGGRTKSGKSLGGSSASGNAIGGAGAAFDRYGPGGLRGVDETLQGSTDCARPGLFRHPKLCNKFYACHWDEWKQKYTLHVFNCPVHLSFDSTAGACNWPSKGPACQDDNLLV